MIEVAKAANVDARDLVDRSVYDAIRKSVGKLWRALLVMTSDYSLIDRTPMFYARTYDRGSLTSDRTAPGQATLPISFRSASDIFPAECAPTASNTS